MINTVRECRQWYMFTINGELEEPLKRLQNVMNATVSHYVDSVASGQKELSAADARELLEYLEVFAARVGSLHDAAKQLTDVSEREAYPSTTITEVGDSVTR